MTGEWSVRIVNFIFRGAGGLVLVRCYVGHYSEYTLSSALSVCIKLIAVVLRKYGAAKFDTVDFRLFYAGAACMRMWTLLTRGRCGVFGAQVAHGALWPLVIMLVA